MIPDRCSLCKGKLHEGKTEFLAHAAGEVIVIKDIPAYVCDQCGEVYYTAEISRKIDGVMQSAHQNIQVHIENPVTWLKEENR
jgi:YgiT-type zinc finger domain-containing protein